MKFLIIGQSLIDQINYRGESEIKPGGIFYSVLGINSVISNNDEIFLVTSLEKKKLKLFSPVYNKVDKKYFYYIDQMPTVYLNIFDDNERGECYSKVTGNLPVENIDEYKSFDGILINMITGFDISLEQLKKIRSSYKGIIYLDVHTLTRGLEENGKRDFRIIPDFIEWIKNIDILQVNETEFRNLFNLNDKYQVINKIFSTGVKILVITKGEKGARIFYPKKNEIVSSFVSALRTDIKNSVGCGDVFGAVFFYSYIYDNNYEKALRLANNKAGLMTTYSKLKNIERLGDDVPTGFG